MQVSVLVEPVKGNGYRASAPNPFNFSVEGATREEVLEELRSRIDARLSNGTELVAIDVGAKEHPLTKFAGMFKDDPYFDEVLKIMAENRRKMDEDPDIL